MLITFAATSALLPGDDGTPCDLNGTKQGHISNSCLDKGPIIVPGDWRLVTSQITEKVEAFEEFMFKDYGEWWEWQAKPYTSEIVNAPYNKITKASRRIVPNSWYCISQQIQKPNLQILRQKIASVPVYITEILTLSKQLEEKLK